MPPWEQRPARQRVLKERRLSANATRMCDPSLCGVPSERIPVPGPFQGCTLRWYASPRWGGERKGPAQTESDARLNHPLGAVRLS